MLINSQTGYFLFIYLALFIGGLGIVHINPAVVAILLNAENQSNMNDAKRRIRRGVPNNSEIPVISPTSTN